MQCPGYSRVGNISSFRFLCCKYYYCTALLSIKFPIVGIVIRVSQYATVTATPAWWDLQNMYKLWVIFSSKSAISLDITTSHHSTPSTFYYSNNSQPHWLAYVLHCTAHIVQLTATTSYKVGVRTIFLVVLVNWSKYIAQLHQQQLFQFQQRTKYRVREV